MWYAGRLLGNMPTLETYGRGEAAVLVVDVIDRAELASGLDPVSGSVVVSDLRASIPEVASLTFGGDDGK